MHTHIGIIIVLCIAFGLLVYKYFFLHTIENFGNNGQNCNYKNRINCLLIAGDVCNWCNKENKCYDKLSDYKCKDYLSDEILLKIKNRGLFIMARDLYDSTTGYFDWNDWYEHNTLFPPFEYKEGRYYFIPNNITSCLYKNKYKFLEYYGVNSSMYNKWFHNPEELDKKILDSINYFRNLGALGRKILRSVIFIA